jgi:hypothetical protein
MQCNAHQLRCTRTQESFMRTFLVLLLSLALVQPAFAQLSAAEHLTLTARVWGLLKYYSLAVTNCQRNWDQVLLDPPPEFGWGLSLQHSGENLVLIFCAQDAQGQARWMIGNVPWRGENELLVPMLRTRGFCSSCAPSAVGVEAAGTIVLKLSNATPGIYTGNSVDIDVQFHDGSSWKRTRLPLSKL